MPIDRIFIDWSEPLLPAVVRALVDGRAPPVDLGTMIVVVPGRRAGRRFRELLTEATGGRHTPPRIVTIGDLPELLYVPKRPFASDLVQRLAWIKAIQSLRPQQLASVVRQLPAADDTAGWFALAELLWRQHRELAADGLNFADVLQRGGELATFGEHGRWRTLAAIQDAYHRELDGLELWDRQTARLVALREREFGTTHRIVLVGMSDLTLVQRQMLDQLADRVTAYVHAPASLTEAFDAHGCVIPEAWSAMPIPIRDGQLLVADGPAEAGGCVAAVLSGFGDRFRTDDISIGLADEGAAAVIVRRLEECGIAGRWSVGPPVTRTPPVQLLAAVADYVELDNTAQFAALARHSDVGDWLTARGAPAGWLPALDAFISQRVPQRLRDWAPRHAGAAWQRAFELVQELVEPLRGRSRPIGEWAPHVTRVLQTVYADAAFLPDDPAAQRTVSGLEALQQALVDQAAAPDGLSPRVPAVTALRLLIDALAQVTVPPPANDAAVELMGWLDIAHDDAPATIVVGLNEGLIPQSANADPFLPDRLRTVLGVTDNQRRYARDAHALLSLLHSCRDSVLIAARRDVRGDPLAPSRLLLATEGGEIAARVRAFYRPERPTPAVEPPPAPLSGRSGFVVPRPRAEIAPPDVLYVTAFRDYLASPYRFYLKHVEGLREVDDSVDELSAAAFGDLAHEVLARFGTSKVRDSQDAAEIRAFLSAALDEVARGAFGGSPVMAVEIQLEQARARLAAFAEWQARWAQQGWTIRFTEASPGDEGIALELPDGECLRVKGRIDRIDRHADGRWMIFDYKTGESGDPPERAHRRDGEWIDLQLPLYRHLARALEVTGDVQLGYLRLPRDTTAVREEVAPWTGEDLESADATIRDVAMRIRRGAYWEELQAEPQTLREFGPICQDDVLNREVLV